MTRRRLLLTRDETVISQLPIQLGPGANGLKSQLEMRFGKGIKFSLNSEMSEHAAALVSEDGTPCIQFRSESDINETAIIHELYHLKFLADGFPQYEMELDAIAQTHSETFYRLYQRIRAALQHASFFPLMRSQGLDPTSDVRLKVGNTKLSSRGDRPRDHADFELAVDLFATMMSGDELASGTFRNGLLVQGWNFSVQKAEALQAIAAGLSFNEPEGEAEALVLALNALFDGEFTFSLVTQKCIPCGQSGYRASVALIRVGFENQLYKPM